MEKIMRFLLVALAVCVPLVPGAQPAAEAGDYGCTVPRYYPSRYFSQPYYSQPYYTQPYTAPCDYPVLPAIAPVIPETAYRVAPELAQARLAQEAANAAINQYKAEVEKQADRARQLASDQRQQEFQNQLLLMLAQQRGAPPAYPAPAPVYYPPPAPPPFAAPAAQPPAIPAAGPPQAAAPRAMAEDQARKGVTASCMPCHATGNPRHLTDFTDPARVPVDKLREAEHRMISDDPEVMMPPEDKPRAVETVQAFHKLINAATKKK